ncbi:MAG: MFS transporter [Chloroflexi bacterium]|nr:MFS transporter [Chloroflexota bacterium]MBU1749901.1 MFS transporter [Chloroflexota bacterium]MBU1877920.1 MFS transporter [Chloroflexota bacterium]
MIIQRQLEHIRNVYDEFPRQFWTLIAAVFIDRVGGALLFPFLTLYITQRFEVGMTEVGVLFGLFSVASIGGSVIGGAFTDRLGRKSMLIFGLVSSALTSLVLGLVSSFEVFFVAVIFVGFFANAGGPAGQAMIADLLPEEKRAQGFGILRVVANLAFVIGPAIGGLLAAQSYLLLFVADAVTSLITAGIVFLVIQETRPEPRQGEVPQSMTQTFGGYGIVLRDVAFTLFMVACILMTIVYMQMNTTLSVYLRDTHGVPAQGFGYILALNATMVVLLQFAITRRVSKVRPLVLMAGGTLLYAIGFGMYGFVSGYVFFLAAMVVITIGEMLVAPTSQALAASFAPEDMRGRYMAVFGFSWTIPSAVGPLLAGLVMDYADPHWVWYAAGVLGLVAAGAFALLQRRVGQKQAAVVEARAQSELLVEQAT